MATTSSQKRKRGEEDGEEEETSISHSPFDITDEQLMDIVRMIRTNRNRRVPAPIFNAE
jgi:hypothetical protein